MISAFNIICYDFFDVELSTLRPLINLKTESPRLEGFI